MKTWGLCKKTKCASTSGMIRRCSTAFLRTVRYLRAAVWREQHDSGEESATSPLIGQEVCIMQRRVKPVDSATSTVCVSIFHCHFHFRGLM